jgi:hypothetical protein
MVKMLDNKARQILIEYKYDFILDFLLTLKPQIIDNITITSIEKGTFLNVNFVSKNSNHCSFEIGFRLNKERRINFFIGEFGGALMQYEEVEDIESEQAILEGILAFLISSVNEQREYCGSKLKKVSYLCSEIIYPESDTMLIFKPYSKPTLFCFNKKFEEIIFEPWDNE